MCQPCFPAAVSRSSRFPHDYVLSIEHEDALMSAEEGLAKGVALLKEAGIMEAPGEMFWA